MLKHILVALGVAVTVGITPLMAAVADGLAQPYLHIQLALANDSMDGVADAAQRIVNEAEKLGVAAQSIGAAAKSISAASDINTARAAFGPLSDALIAYGEEVGFGDLKVAYCPMARKSWVQEDGAILNPFYGSMMLNCGGFR
ncbi:MAG: DUF3347 domain-containing protein [Acidobacteriota bacterium]|nr:DUF3347 domain-containing protein [Acidobacteriota bacterium]